MSRKPAQPKAPKVLPRVKVRGLDFLENPVWADQGWLCRAAIVLDIEPKAKGRPRFARATGRTYTPKTTEEWETTVGRSVAGLCSIEPHEVVRIEMVAVMPRPLSRPADVSPARWKVGGELYRVSGPDIDNIAKALLDAIQYRQARKTLERLGFLDNDRQVCDLLTRRVTAARGADPCLRLIVSTLANL